MTNTIKMKVIPNSDKIRSTEKKKALCSMICTLGLVLIMVGLSELTAEKEIIFPEITAIAIGALVSPKLSWRTSYLRMIILIGLCAILGLGMVMLPIPLWVKIPIAFLVCQLLYLYSGTTFAPLISATILPILMHTESVIYPITAVGFTGLVVCVAYLMKKMFAKENEQKLEKESFTPVEKPSRTDLVQMLLRCILVTLFVIIILKMDARFCIAPPLLVAFTEFSKVECKARKHSVKTVILLSTGACLGVFSRLLFTVRFGLPLTVAAVVTIFLLLLLLHKMKMYLPPVGAIAILPMIIPQTELISYPIEIFVGSAVFMILAVVFFAEETQEVVKITLDEL